MADLIVNDLTVINKLTSGNQIGGTLTLQGLGSRQPATEKALVVKTGAIFNGLVTVGSLAVGDLEVLGNVNATNFGPILTDSITASSFVQCPRVTASIFSRTFYVATPETPISGTETPNGSVTNPFTSIQAAINAGAAKYPEDNIQIVVAAGVYEGDVTISSFTTILASTRNPSDTIIDGNIEIFVTSDSSPKVVTLEGLRVNGKITCLQTYIYDLIINNCVISLQPDSYGFFSNAANLNIYMNGVQFVSMPNASPLFISGSSLSCNIVNCSFNATVNYSTYASTFVSITNLSNVIGNHFTIKWDDRIVPPESFNMYILNVAISSPLNIKNNFFVVSSFPDTGQISITGIKSLSNIILQGNTFDIPSLNGNNRGACVDNGTDLDGPVVYTAVNTKLAGSVSISITGPTEPLAII
jgi:hypothetical protein